MTFGGYGIYISAAFGITFFVLGINIGFSIYEKYRIKKMIRHETQS